MRALIVDDEPLARRGLTIRLKAYPDIEIIQQCRNGREAVASINELGPELVFLDIQMPGMDGFEVIKAIEPLAKSPLFIFVTAYDQYAIDAFDVHAIDYLLKPIDNERLNRAIEKVRRQLKHEGALDHKQRLIDFVVELTGESSHHFETMVDNDEPLTTRQYADTLTIKDGDKTHLVEMTSIDWIDAAGDYMCIHAAGNTYILRKTMKQLDQELNPKIFQRIHRSTIVNLSRICRICTHINGEYFLILKNDTELKMSRSYRSKIKQIIYPSFD